MPDSHVKRPASFVLTQKANVIIFSEGVVQYDHFINVIIIVYSLLLLILTSQCHCYSNELVIMNFRVPWFLTFPIFKYLLSNFIISVYCTSIYISFEIISVKGWNEIFRSGFLGAVIQFTHSLGNDVIKTLTSDVLVACS